MWWTAHNHWKTADAFNETWKKTLCLGMICWVYFQPLVPYKLIYKSSILFRAHHRGLIFLMWNLWSSLLCQLQFSTPSPKNDVCIQRCHVVLKGFVNKWGSHLLVRSDLQGGGWNGRRACAGLTCQRPEFEAKVPREVGFRQEKCWG